MKDFIITAIFIGVMFGVMSVFNGVFPTAGTGLTVIISIVIGGAITSKIIDELWPEDKSKPTYVETEYPADWDEIRHSVLARDGYTCGNCGINSGPFHVHHIVPLSKGGTNNMGNLRTLCENCHKDIHPHMRQ